MRIKDVKDPEVIRFLTYSYERENIVRLAWLKKYQDKLQQACTLSREPKNTLDIDDIAVSIGCAVESLRAHFRHESSHYRRAPIRDGIFIPGVKDLRQGHSIVDLGLGDPKEDPRLARPYTDLTFDPVMRPVDPQIMDILYKPKDTLRRLEYLKKRQQVAPDKKYYMRECSSWEYGWKVDESPLLERSLYGNVNELVKDLSRTGPQPDPRHYGDGRAVYKCIQLRP